MKGIYCFTNIKNNKKYIGQSMCLENRKRSHLRNFNNPNLDSYNTTFHLALRKYSIKNFSYSILFSTDDFISREDLNHLEIYYISKYDSYKNGYNMNRGGESLPLEVNHYQKKMF